MRDFVRHGITLTEVVVGIALLGSLLSLVIVGTGRLARTQRLADLKIIAIEELDRRLCEWSLSGYPEAGESGGCKLSSKLFWHVEHRESYLGTRRLVIVRAHISEIGESGRLRLPDGLGSEISIPKPIASVEVMVSESIIGRRFR
jgi:hypothetical protein